MRNLLKIFICFCVFMNGVINFSQCNICLKNEHNLDSFCLEKCYAEKESESLYAKVLDDCILFKNKEMIYNFDSIYFQIPKSYFVLILETISEKCLKVQYGNYIGFIDSSKIEIAKFTPIVKTLDGIKFDIKENVGTKIWQYPTSSSNVLVTLSAGTKDIVYIASISGDVPVGGKSDVWYYVFYTPSIDSTNVYEGYIYSENTTNLSEIVLNNETNPVVISSENKTDEKLIYISTTIKTIVIIIIAVPIILFFAIILYKLTRKLSKNTKYNKNNLTNSNVQGEEFVKNQNIKSIEKYKNLRLIKNKNLQPKFDVFDDEELL